MNIRHRLFAPILTTLVLVLAACSASTPPPPARATHPTMPSMSGMPGMGSGQSSPVAIPSDAQHVKVVGTEFQFAPTSMNVAATSPVAITFENDGTTDHDWTVHRRDGTEIAHAHATSGESTVLVMNFEPGSYQVWCTVAGHKEAGMVGSLKVT